jgi:outer membrane receptor protein involved in Fe transport
MKPGLSLLTIAALLSWCFVEVTAAEPENATQTPPEPSPEASPATPPKNGGLSDLSIEELLQLEVATVTTASKKSEKSTAAPATVIVISDRDIRLRGYATLKDVLRDLPGMETIENYFSEIGTLVPVRGIAGNNKIVV